MSTITKTIFGLLMLARGVFMKPQITLFCIFAMLLAACSSSAAPTQPTETPLPPTPTFIAPTETPIPPTETQLPPTETPIPPTETPLPPTVTPEPSVTPTPEGPKMGDEVYRGPWPGLKYDVTIILDSILGNPTEDIAKLDVAPGILPVFDINIMKNLFVTNTSINGRQWEKVPSIQMRLVGAKIYDVTTYFDFPGGLKQVSGAYGDLYFAYKTPDEAVHILRIPIGDVVSNKRELTSLGGADLPAKIGQNLKVAIALQTTSRRITRQFMLDYFLRRPNTDPFFEKRIILAAMCMAVDTPTNLNKEILYELLNTQSVEDFSGDNLGAVVTGLSIAQ